MEKIRLMKLMRQKVYLERERDKIFFNVFFLFIYFFIRIQTIQQKLIRLNQRLLEELDNLSDTDIKVK